MYILSGSIWDVVISAIGDFKKYFKRIEANNFAYHLKDLLRTSLAHNPFSDGQVCRNRAKELGIAASQILFVGNSNNDEKVKALSGAKTLLVNPHRTRASQEWDFYIPHMKSLTEILPLIGIVDSSPNEPVESTGKVNTQLYLLKQEEVMKL